MNVQQREALFATLKSLADVNLIESAKKAYATNDLRSVVVTDFKLPELTGMIRRVADQLLTELNNGNWRILPFNYQSAEYGGETLQSRLQNVINTLESGRRFDAMLPHLLWLVNYQVELGFWDRSKLKVRNPDELKLQEESEHLRLMKAEVEKSLQELHTLRTQLEEEKANIVQLIQDKQTDFRTIQTNQQQSTNLLNEITRFESDAKSSSKSVEIILEQQKAISEDARKRLDEERKAFDELKDDFTKTRESADKQVKYLARKNQEFSEVMDLAESQKDFLDQKRKEIAKFAGFAADQVLGSSFEDRKNELSIPTQTWRTATFWTGALSLGWVLFVLAYFGSDNKETINWPLTIINVVRTLPAFGVFFWVASQYNRERKLQEVYAFKAAVAKTTSAYADMIDDEVEKVKMLISTVQGVYTPPTSDADTMPSVLNAALLSDITKQITNATKEITEKAVAASTEKIESLLSKKP